MEQDTPFLLIVQGCCAVCLREPELWNEKVLLLNSASPLSSCETVSSLFNCLEAHFQVL